MVSGLFKLIGVNKMLDKQGAEFDKLLEGYSKKQKKPLKIPYNKMQAFICAGGKEKWDFLRIM